MKEIFKVDKILGNCDATTADQAWAIFTTLCNPLREGKKIILDFSKIKKITSKFLSMLLIDLYDYFGEFYIDKHIQFRAIQNNRYSKLNLCKKNIAAYNGDIENYLNVVNKILT